MADYKRLISYIYSYEKGEKTKNSGFAKIESRNGICKLNISLRISDILMNEAEDNAMEVFLFCRKNNRIEKIFIGRIRIVSGCSIFKIQMNSENIGDKRIPLSDVAGIFICSTAFLHRNSQLNIVYASEWDDISIDVDAFTEDQNEAGETVTLQQGEKKDTNEEMDVLYEQSEIKASEIEKNGGSDDKAEVKEKNLEIQYGEKKFETAQSQMTQPDRINQGKIHTGEERTGKEMPKEDGNGRKTETIVMGTGTNETEIRENDNIETDEKEIMSDEQVRNSSQAKQSSTEQFSINTETGMETNEIDTPPDCEACKRQLKEMLLKEKNDEVKNKAPDTGDYFKMLCNCYPKVKVNEIDGECIKITPHDISYLPKKYWNLCNNSFLLHGYYNYKYLLLCEKTINNENKYMICVPGMFHNKEQTMARMFGFTEFEGRKQNSMMSFGYWCMYL